MRVNAGIIDALKPITTAGMQPDLKSGIANFYDESSGLVRGLTLGPGSLKSPAVVKTLVTI